MKGIVIGPKNTPSRIPSPLRQSTIDLDTDDQQIPLPMNFEIDPIIHFDESLPFALLTSGLSDWSSEDSDWDGTVYAFDDELPSGGQAVVPTSAEVKTFS